jgi:MFS family permease
MLPVSTDRVAAETWFLKRGLPSVLTRRARWRRLWQRSAPVLAGFASTTVAALIIAVATGFQRVDIDLEPTRGEWVVIAVLPAIVPIAFLVGWLVSRIDDARHRRLASTAAVAIMFTANIINGSLSDAVEDVWSTVTLVAVILVFTGLGIGSIIGWALRLTTTHLASVATLALRALPVVLLTVLVFFNGYVWSMATLITRTRIWLVIAFLVLIATAFLVTGLAERIHPLLSSTTPIDTDDERLAGTPFEGRRESTDRRHDLHRRDDVHVRQRQGRRRRRIPVAVPRPAHR